MLTGLSGHVGLIRFAFAVAVANKDHHNVYDKSSITCCNWATIRTKHLFVFVFNNSFVRKSWLQPSWALQNQEPNTREGEPCKLQRRMDLPGFKTDLIDFISISFEGHITDRGQEDILHAGWVSATFFVYFTSASGRLDCITWESAPPKSQETVLAV